MSKVLLVGEQAQSWKLEFKGADYFGYAAFHQAGKVLVAALRKEGHEVDWIQTCNVAVDFPEKLPEIAGYDAILLSDIGSNTFLFHPEMLGQGVRHPNRLAMLRDYVREGGGLAMIGGWMSFGGMDGRARYYCTPLADALPVICQPHDDRIETPEGSVPTVASDHPVIEGLPKEWPYFLGYNQVEPKLDATVVMTFERDPLLVVGSYGKGKSAAFTTDCAPHWWPRPFLDWEGYSRLWSNLVTWLGGEA